MTRFLFIITVIVSILTIEGCDTNKSLETHDLRCENLVNPLGINTVLPQFSWKISSLQKGIKQQSYQILVATDSTLLNDTKADLWNSGKVDSPSSLWVTYNGKTLASSTAAYWKVRVWDNAGEVSEWSNTALFSVGLLAPENWNGSYIGLSPEAGNIQSPLLRKQFEMPANTKKMFLHVNSLGYHEVYINGKRVGEDVLSPSVSQLNKRSLSVTYDVSSYTHKGVNDLVLWLGQGWYRPELPGVIYNGPLVKAQLEGLTDGEYKVVAVSDQSWKGRESGYSGIGSWKPLQFGGEQVDASLVLPDLTTETLDRVAWYSVAEVDVPTHIVSPQMNEPNRIMAEIKAVDVQALGDSVWLVKMEKALTGWVEIHFPQLNKGQEIIMEYGDHLDNEGKLANQNQIDRYLASGQTQEVFRNKFNYHGFQYIKISNLHSKPVLKDIKAFLIHPNFKQASSFQCSDPDMNRIHDMIQYTFRCLSLGGYLVDCPQLERLGYGGDGNASTKTAQLMYNLSPLYTNWIEAWGDCIREDGGMPHTAPNPYPAGGGPFWCGFIIPASWHTYVNYGDPRLIKKHYTKMQQWLGYVDKYSVNGLLKTWPNNDYRGWYLGDWATPTGVDQTAPASVDLVNNCFISECFLTMTKIATALGNTKDAEMYTLRRNQLRGLIQETFFNKANNSYATESQIDLTYPMLAEVTPELYAQAVSNKLHTKTAETWKGHLACGLVGIPVITEWATKNEEADWIYSMLKKKDYPGYLYMIENGATTSWEHWNGERSRIHNCYNGIGSWFYQAIGGIRPDEKAPGYRNIFIQPQIPEGVTWAKTSKETPYGTVTVNWSLEKDRLTLDVIIPIGSSATVILPKNVYDYILDGQKCVSENNTSLITIESGAYTLSYMLK